MSSLFFFFNDTATTEIYTLPLHDALPISFKSPSRNEDGFSRRARFQNLFVSAGGLGKRQLLADDRAKSAEARSEEHTSELQSRSDLVCRLLLEKKKSERLLNTTYVRVRSV